MKHLFLSAVTVFSLGTVCTHAFADHHASTVHKTTISKTEATSAFVKKRYSIKGDWTVVDDNGVETIKFSQSFKTKGGPDLKVYLSKMPMAELGKDNAAQTALSIGVLKSNKGEQLYTLPDGISLSDYKSVIIYCASFSVLWGGFDLPIAPTTPIAPNAETSTPPTPPTTQRHLNAAD